MINDSYVAADCDLPNRNGDPDAISGVIRKEVPRKLEVPIIIPVYMTLVAGTTLHSCIHVWVIVVLRNYIISSSLSHV